MRGGNGKQERKVGAADQHFAANLKAVRNARGLTLRDLSDALAETDTPMVPSGLSKIEGFHRTATVGEAVNISDILNVPLGVMLAGPVTVRVEVSA